MFAFRGIVCALLVSPATSRDMQALSVVLLLALSALVSGKRHEGQKKKKRGPARLCCDPLLTVALPKGTPDLVSLYVDSWSFNQTGFEASCNVSVAQGLLYSDWQQMLQSSSFGAAGAAGGIMYAEVNAAAPGNLVVGLADAAGNFFGFLHTGAADALGAAVSGTLEDVVLPLPSNKRIAGSGGNGNVSTVSLRRLSPSGIVAGGAAIPASLNPPSGSVYGSPSDTSGACIGGAVCTVSTRWEVRVVIGGTGTVSVWAWAQGYRQFFHSFAGSAVDMRFSQIAMHVFNMNAGSTAVPLYPLLSGIDMRFKQESSFSRVASRIFSAPDIRPLLPAALLFAAPSSSVFALSAAVPGQPCPALNFVASGAAPSGYTPLLVWSLGAMGVSLSSDSSYTVSLSAFVNNISSVNSSVLVSLYDGATALGVVTMPPQDGIWGQALSAPTPLSASAALNFPLGAPFLPAQHNPSQALLAASVPPYSSRRVSLDLRLWRVNNLASFSLFASDPESPLAQRSGNLRLRALTSAYPLTPAVSTADLALNAFSVGAADLRVVVWARGSETSGLGVTGAAAVIDRADVGCGGADNGGIFGPPPVVDECGVCGGNNASCCSGAGCCKNYNGVSDACWNWLLLQASAADLVSYLTALRAALVAQCPLLDKGTQGTPSCCSPSQWGNSTAAIETRACSNNVWGPQCLLPFLQQTQALSMQLSSFVTPK